MSGRRQRVLRKARKAERDELDREFDTRLAVAVAARQASLTEANAAYEKALSDAKIARAQARREADAALGKARVALLKELTATEKAAA